MKYKVTDANGNELTVSTIKEAVQYIKKSVLEEAESLYENYEIDKYAVEDICFQLEENIAKQFGYSHPDLNNEWEIEMI